MPIQIGSAFGPRSPVTPVPPVEVTPPSHEEDRLAGVLEAIQRISFPPVVVDPPDLSDIVTAVTSLKPGPTAAEIAAAIADVILPPPAGDDGASLREVAEALRNLDFRLQGLGRQAYGGGSVTLQPGSTVGISNQVSTLEQTGLVPKVYDYISLGYTGSDLTTVVYKTGGSGGTTVATLTLAYSSSILQTVTRT